MKSFREGLFLLLGAALVIWSFYVFLNSPAPARYQTGLMIEIGEHRIPVEIADSESERVLGLSGREELLPNTGLLFVFNKPSIQGIWMKDMRFSIDIVFLDAEFRVINLYQGVAPETFPTVFYSSAPALYVLELNSGEAVNLGLTEGAQASLYR